MAVYKTFGIGLGFNFEHMSKLAENEVPSARRLQARAAKSAIRKAQEIQNPRAAREKLDGITDPDERKQAKEELRRRDDAEIQFLAKRLSELIPTDLSLDNQQVQRYEMGGYEHISPHEFVIQSPTIEDLMKKTGESTSYEIDYLNPSGQPSPEKDDEFIEAWEKENRRAGGIEGGQSHDDDDDIRTVLA